MTFVDDVDADVHGVVFQTVQEGIAADATLWTILCGLAGAQGCCRVTTIAQWLGNKDRTCLLPGAIFLPVVPYCHIVA
jgi:hypothetical protein